MPDFAEAREELPSMPFERGIRIHLDACWRHLRQAVVALILGDGDPQRRAWVKAPIKDY